MSNITAPSIEAVYIGDGVYAEFDGFSIWLKTERENGWHGIALEGPMLKALINYAEPIFGRYLQ